ncbi:MAG: hypothetical protein AVDCRST_MAG60-1166, partial [uncultured Nocardioides sp.]
CDRRSPTCPVPVKSRCGTTHARRGSRRAPRRSRSGWAGSSWPAPRSHCGCWRRAIPRRTTCRWTPSSRGCCVRSRARPSASGREWRPTTTWSPAPPRRHVQPGPIRSPQRASRPSATTCRSCPDSSTRAWSTARSSVPRKAASTADGSPTAWSGRSRVRPAAAGG